MTDAPGASSAVWPRPLRRSQPEQAKATGKWRDNIRRGGSGLVSQSEQQETRGDLTCRFPAPPLEKSLGQVPM